MFDALQAARGVTPYSKLESVRITRKRPLSQGGGRVRTEINFLRLISDGDEDVNIRLYDGDTIFVDKSKNVLRDQLLAASRTNLSPDFIEVFVSGRVKEPGPQQLPQGASLNQAIASAGGPMLLKGKVEFLRFTEEGATDRRIFNFNPKSTAGDYRNPVLMAGDVVRVNPSVLSASLELLNEITAPALVVFRIHNLQGCIAMTFNKMDMINSQQNDDQMDFGQIASKGRQKLLIGAFTVSAAVAGTIYAFSLKHIWEGSFQIVLENQSNSVSGGIGQLAASNPSLPILLA